ncbi:hypothetical protein [Polaribacter butkevichii]|uniref:Uncharacterized protein n=1 Tax=Polaribacter butkevichii TaxID=218490 RepID=A0A2P6CEN5_9FLAO|nr:hypothetical protein [Polaribacter butkevichii]PQJ73361.1 hypothetical protein BTO14_08845 [Polaribacter butkevichii]
MNATNFYSQSFKVNLGFLLKAQIQLGNQNQGIKLGAYGLGTAQFNDLSMETGVALYSGYLLKKYTVKTSGLNFGYDFFTLLGIGNNNNFLGSSFFEDGPLLATIENKQRFYGIGFGFEKEFLPKELSTFNQRLGKFLLRFSDEGSSINIQLKNDFRAGKIFYGEGTDFGKTGMLKLSYSRVVNPKEIVHVGMAVSLFTPLQDYSKTPNNLMNSDDESKNVWYTKAPYKNLFYANLYVFGGYQNDSFSGFLKAGVNSQKLGAFVQNTLHDSFGLNPRFPWNVSEKDKLFLEFNTSINTQNTNE